MSDDNQWHLSKSIPISFIVAIILQTAGLVWYVSSLDSAIKANAKEILRNETRLNTITGIVQNQAVTLGRMDENIKAIRLSVEKMANN